MKYIHIGIVAGPHEVRLIDNLLASYNSYERPAEVDNAPLKVEFLVTLRSIIDVVSYRFYSLAWALFNLTDLWIG